MARMSEDSTTRRFGPTPTSNFREDSAQKSRRFGPEAGKIRPRSREDSAPRPERFSPPYVIVFLFNVMCLYLLNDMVIFIYCRRICKIYCQLSCCIITIFIGLSRVLSITLLRKFGPTFQSKRRLGPVYFTFDLFSLQYHMDIFVSL